jgi:hypothetical protein
VCPSPSTCSGWGTRSATSQQSSAEAARRCDRTWGGGGAVGVAHTEWRCVAVTVR